MTIRDAGEGLPIALVGPTLGPMKQHLLQVRAAGLRLWWALWLLATVALTSSSAHAQVFRVPEEVPTFAQWEAPALPDDWVEVRGAGFVLHGSEAHVALMDRLVAHGDQAVPRLAAELGIPIGGPIDVFLAGSQEDFRRLQPGAPPVWADGTAYPSLGAIFLRHPSLRGGSNRPLEQVLDHELVHVLLGRVFDPNPVPRWLQEGLAQVYAGEVGPEIAQRIQRGSLGRSPLALQAITTGFPDDGPSADLAYAQSADFILWFRSSYGDEALRQVIRLMGAGRSERQAIYEVTGSTLDQLGAVWLERLEVQTSGTIAPEYLESAVYGVGGLLMMGVGWSRRRAFRQRIASWQRDDRELEALARDVAARRRG